MTTRVIAMIRLLFREMKKQSVFMEEIARLPSRQDSCHAMTFYFAYRHADYFQHMLRSRKKLDSVAWRNFKIEAIAHECGFNNRNSFTNAFKKFKGVYPSDYKASRDAHEGIPKASINT